MKELFEHNALKRTDSLAHDHMGAPDSLKELCFVGSLRDDRKLFFPVYRHQRRQGLKNLRNLFFW